MLLVIIPCASFTCLHHFKELATNNQLAEFLTHSSNYGHPPLVLLLPLFSPVRASQRKNTHLPTCTCAQVHPCAKIKTQNSTRAWSRTGSQ